MKITTLKLGDITIEMVHNPMYEEEMGMYEWKLYPNDPPITTLHLDEKGNVIEFDDTKKNICN